MGKRAIGFGRWGETTKETTSIRRPIGFVREGKYSLSEEVSHIIDMGFAPSYTACLIAEKMADIYYKATAKNKKYLSDESQALEAEIKKIKKMKRFGELLKAAKKWAENEEEPTTELAKVYKSIGFCEYITGRKKDGVKDIALGIMTLLSLDKTEEAIQEIKITASLASNEKYEKAERVLKTLFEEMIDSQHPRAIIEAGNAFAEFYKENGMYKEAADVFGSILLTYQANLENKEITELYTDIVLPAFIECKKKVGEDVVPSIMIAFDDMYHVAARNIELTYFQRLKDIVKILLDEMKTTTAMERKEIATRLQKYIELFLVRKQQYKIEEQEFLIDYIKDIFKQRRKSIQKFE